MEESHLGHKILNQIHLVHMDGVVSLRREYFEKEIGKTKKFGFWLAE